MKTAALLLALAVVAVSGCLTPGDAPPSDPIDRDDATEFKRVHEWNTTHQGDLGLKIHVEVESRCILTGFLRGKSIDYELVGYFATRDDAEYGILTSVSSSGTTHLLEPQVSASIAGTEWGTDLDFESEWVRTVGRDFTFDGEGTVFVAFVGLDSSVSIPDSYAREDRYYWQPEAETSAHWRLECDKPAKVLVEAVTERILLVDDLSLRGDGLSASATDNGLPLAYATSTGINIDVEGELTFFGSLPAHLEKVLYMTLKGPGVEYAWIGATYILGVGDYDAYAEGPTGTYRLDLTEVGAGPFIGFSLAFFDFDPR